MRMSDNSSVNSTPKKRGRPPKNRGAETNSKQSQNPQNEFCSMNSSYAFSDYYFGFNILDFYSPDVLAMLTRDPIGNNQVLRDISLVLYGTNGNYTNTVDYLTAMPTLDKVVVTHGKS